MTQDFTQTYIDVESSPISTAPNYELCSACEDWTRRNLNVIKMFSSDPVTLRDLFKEKLCDGCHNNLMKTMESL